MMINTRRAPRRQLRFESIEDALIELDRIEVAEQRHALRAVGNWTPSQIMTHIAAWIEYGWNGYPMKSLPFFFRWILRRMRYKFLRDGLKAGVRIPGIAGGTTGAEKVPMPVAMSRLRSAFKRLQANEPLKYGSPVFGMLKWDEHVQLQLRHAELHLSFLSIDDEGPQITGRSKAAPG
jgi:hypothetical protein